MNLIGNLRTVEADKRETLREFHPELHSFSPILPPRAESKRHLRLARAWAYFFALNRALLSPHLGRIDSTVAVQMIIHGLLRGHPLKWLHNAPLRSRLFEKLEIGKAP